MNDALMFQMPPPAINYAATVRSSYQGARNNNQIGFSPLEKQMSLQRKKTPLMSLNTP